uniref:Uncharacterized protein n=1 Tax=Triticum urartu TaxID=4572 RepID=A0A8R7QBB0_TRIUA
MPPRVAPDPRVSGGLDTTFAEEHRGRYTADAWEDAAGGQRCRHAHHVGHVEPALVEGCAVDPAYRVLGLHRPGCVSRAPKEERVPNLCARDFLARDRHPARR